MKVSVRRQVFERDRHCQDCGTSGSRGTPLTIHHIKPKFQFPELAGDPDNMILVCRRCHDIRHGIVHKEKGKRKKGWYWQKEMLE